MFRRILPVSWIPFALLLSGGPSPGAEASAPAETARKMSPALLVIDVQNAYLPYMSEEDKKFAPLVINGAIALFREHGLPVIRIYHNDSRWRLKPGSKEFRFAEVFRVKDSDPVIVKGYPNAFKKTGLKKMLDDKGINTLFLTGLSATGCVLATYRGADDLDYDVFLVKDGLISANPRQTEMIEDISNTVNYDGLKLILDNLPR